MNEKISNLKGVFAVILAAMLLFPFNETHAGIAVGEWREHHAYHNATHSVNAFGQIFVLSDGAIFSFDPKDNAIYTYGKTLGLSDSYITHMEYCNSENCIILVYSTGNIDLLYKNESIYNFPDIKKSDITDKNINSVTISGSTAYLASNIGLIEFNVKRREIKATYKFSDAVSQAVLSADGKYLFCATKSGIYRGSVDENLLDNSKWKLICNAVFDQLILFDGTLIGRNTSNTICVISEVGKVTKLEGSRVGHINLSGGNLFNYAGSDVTEYSSISGKREYTLVESGIQDILFNGKDYWVCSGPEGLSHYEQRDESLVCTISKIIPNSPRRNIFHSFTWPETERMLAVSGCQNYNGIDYPGTVMIYENDRWTYLDDDITSKTGLKYINLTHAVEDPDEKGHIFVGSARQGLYEFRNYKFEKLWSCDNSILKNILEVHKKDYVSVSSLTYDKDGNLWMTNNEIDTIVRILRKDGKWTSLYYADIDGMPTFNGIKFDSKGHAWLNASRSRPGLFCIDTNGTLDNNKDDKSRFTGSIFTNQDGTSEEIYDIFFFDFDLDGTMWIGTNRGIYIMRNPEEFITSKKNMMERIKISREDGSGLADYLMSGVFTTALMIDQGNRKWVGTMNDGVFLLSPDGTHTLEHFTTENSPLPSDNIISITQNVENGSIFFGTELGMIEYGGTARKSENNLSESLISAYPNPVYPDFDGVVTITGISENSIVRIVGPSGQLVNQGTSLGGAYSWNCCDSNGNRVASGVYQAIVTDSNGNNSVTTGITVVR